jgi:hypothetical protein
MSEEYGTTFAFYEIDCSKTPMIRKLKEGFNKGGSFSVCHPNWPAHSFYVTVSPDWGTEVRGLNDTKVYRIIGGRWIVAAGEDIVAVEVKVGTAEAQVVALRSSEALRFAWGKIRSYLEPREILKTMQMNGAKGIRAMIKKMLVGEMDVG